MGLRSKMVNQLSNVDKNVFDRGYGSTFNYTKNKILHQFLFFKIFLNKIFDVEMQNFRVKRQSFWSKK